MAKVDIDTELLTEAVRISGLSSEREVVEAALRFFVRTKRQVSLRELRGKLHWKGDLEQSRTGRLE